MPPGLSTPTASQEGSGPVPDPSQPTRRRIHLSSLERQRLSSLNLTPDPEMEPPPKPPRSCSALARHALKSSFVGWGLPVQSPQGNCHPRRCADPGWDRVGALSSCRGILGNTEGVVGIPGRASLSSAPFFSVPPMPQHTHSVFTRLAGPPSPPCSLLPDWGRCWRQ